MTSRTTAQENRHMLAGIVKCTACGAVMVNLGGRIHLPQEYHQDARTLLHNEP